MKALGLIEVIGYISAIEACDVCLKSANVNIVSIDKIGSGIVTVSITGDVGAVKASIDSSQLAVKRIGKLRATHVIPRVNNEVGDFIFNNTKEVTNVSSKVDIKHDNDVHDEKNCVPIDKSDISKKSVKELKCLVKIFDPTRTYKQLNKLKKEELIDLYKKLSGEDR